MIERRLGAHAHEFPRADFDHGNAGVIMEMWDDMIRHCAILRGLVPLKLK